MSHGIVIQNAVQAMNIDTLNRSVKCADAIDNGFVFKLLNLSAVSGEGEVWIASTPTSSAGLQNLWMAYEPEVVLTVSGTKQYKGINPDVRDFYNIAGSIFSAFQPQVADIITLTADDLGGSLNAFAVATAADYKLNWAAGAVAGLSLKLLTTDYISIADGSIGNQRVVSYRFEVVAVA
jgi:hypothetical protein